MNKRFLETVGALDDNILIPIDRIQYVSIRYRDGGWQIAIAGDNKMDIVECFGKNEDKLNKRYEQIKKILG